LLKSKPSRPPTRGNYIHDYSSQKEGNRFSKIMRRSARKREEIKEWERPSIFATRPTDDINKSGECPRIGGGKEGDADLEKRQSGLPSRKRRYLTKHR